jgi:iron complex transport system substrate-binding protein
VALTPEAHAGAIEVVDDSGEKIVLERPAKRIIALYGAYNEILAAMGLESRLVGRTSADRLPPSILAKPSIGTHMRPNVELVLALKPDLIVQGAGRRQAMMPVNQLRRQNLNVAVFNPISFSDLFSVVLRLGELTGEPGKAAGLVASLRTRLKAVKDRLKGVERRPTVFFEVRYPNLLAAGRRSIVNDVIEHAGGSNCVKVDKKLIRLNMEALILADPDFYIIQRGPMNRNPEPPAERPHFRILECVRKGRIMTVDEQVFSRPGPRSVEAVEQLAAFLHAESHKDLRTTK